MVEAAKLWSIVIIFVTSSFMGIILPYVVLKVLVTRCQSMTRFNRVISAMNCFSGGVFIATSLLILLPEGKEKTEEALELLHVDTEYPVTELLLGLGFLLILLIESLVTVCHQRWSTSNTSIRDTPVKENNTTPETEMNARNQNGNVNIYTVEDVANRDPVTDDIAVEVSHHGHEFHGEGMTAIQCIVLLVALSIHMVFDGLSLALLNDETDIWSMLLALVIHKALIFFSMGLKMYESTTVRKFIAVMLYLALVTPIGAGIGIAISSNGNEVSAAEETTSAVLQSIAAGTFVYVAMFEILLKELSSTDYKLTKSICVIIGYVFFAIIKYIGPA